MQRLEEHTVSTAHPPLSREGTAAMKNTPIVEDFTLLSAQCDESLDNRSYLEQCPVSAGNHIASLHCYRAEDRSISCMRSVSLMREVSLCYRDLDLAAEYQASNPSGCSTVVMSKAPLSALFQRIWCILFVKRW